MRQISRLAFPILVTCLTQSSLAHHSPVQYQMSEVVEKSATVLRFEFRNPHSYIHVRDMDDIEWTLETSSASDCVVRVGPLGCFQLVMR